VGSFFTAVLVVAVFVWLMRVWNARREERGEGPRVSASVFRVKFRRGRAVEVEGRIPRNMLHAFEDIAAHAEIDGEVRLAGRSDLHFSDTIPEGVRQQLRNAFVASAMVH
jgi:hypothetical protein